MIKTAQQDKTQTITLQPNRSASWLQSKVLLLVIGSFVLMIALAWSLAGAWMILPFAGLEVALLAVLMYQVSHATYRRQVITIDGTHIRIQWGTHSPRRQWLFSRDETQLTVTESETEWELPQLVLKAPQQQLPIGDFLNRSDRLELKKLLRDAGIHVQSNLWWRQSH